MFLGSVLGPDDYGAGWWESLLVYGVYSGDFVVVFFSLNQVPGVMDVLM